jgi:hypothetical protein
LPGEREPIRVLGWIVREKIKDLIQETAVTFMLLPKDNEHKIRRYVQTCVKNKRS